MHKRLLRNAIFLLAFFVLFYSWSVYADGGPSEDVRRAANEAMKGFLSPDRLDDLRELGFESKADINKAILGEGFEIFTIPPDALLDDTRLQDLHSLITSTNQWSFLVRANDEPKMVVTVGLSKGKWEPVSFGASGFAKVMSLFLNEWPKSSGYRFRYVKVYQANSSFIELSKGKEVIGIVPGQNLTGLLTGTVPEGHDPKKLLKKEHILQALRDAVKKNKENWKRPSEGQK